MTREQMIATFVLHGWDVCYYSLSQRPMRGIEHPQYGFLTVGAVGVVMFTREMQTQGVAVSTTPSHWRTIPTSVLIQLFNYLGERQWQL